jgi:PERQ amino acid-rich with GYF domain-containing protein
MFDQPIVSAATHSIHDQEPASKVDAPWGTTNDASSDVRHTFDVPKPVSETIVTPSAWVQAATVSQAVADIDSSQWLPTGSDVPSSLADKEAFEPLMVSRVPVPEQAITSEPAPEPVTETAPASTKSRAKPTPKQSAVTTAAQTVAPDLMSPVQKTAWAKDNEQKNKPSGIALSLREIQEAEAKNVEARKAADREKEKVARTTSSTSGLKVGVEDVQFTGSWGLPTSQAGRSNVNASQVRDLTPTTTSPGPWTTGAKLGAKKTMKEIQEEEELRKKASAGSDAVAATKRGYSESASKVNVSFH